MTAPAAPAPLFWTGVPAPAWVFGTRRTEPYAIDWPAFPSFTTMGQVRNLRPALTDAAMDSGGFTLVSKYGEWPVAPSQYVRFLRRYTAESGRLIWASPQDWMCEPEIITGGRRGPEVYAGTGLSVAEHQRLTVENYLTLRTLAPELPIIPVVQGWEVHEYERCVELYDAHGIDLRAEPLVGVGSVCRRADTPTGAAIFATLAKAGLRMHGFGVHTRAILRILRALAEIGRIDALISTDSMAWSALARRRNLRLPGCHHGVTGDGNCANCPVWAGLWRGELLADIDRWHRDLTTGPLQLAMGGAA